MVTPRPSWGLRTWDVHGGGYFILRVWTLPLGETHGGPSDADRNTSLPPTIRRSKFPEIPLLHHECLRGLGLTGPNLPPPPSSPGSSPTDPSSPQWGGSGWDGRRDGPVWTGVGERSRDRRLGVRNRPKDTLPSLVPLRPRPSSSLHESPFLRRWTLSVQRWAYEGCTYLLVASVGVDVTYARTNV